MYCCISLTFEGLTKVAEMTFNTKYYSPHCHSGKLMSPEEVIIDRRGSFTEYTEVMLMEDAT